jgi:hypothetical protein
MKIKIIAILLIGFLVSCTKETTIEPITINGYWYDKPNKDSSSFTEYISLKDSVHIYKNLITKKEIKGKVYLLPLDKIFINNSVQTYKFDAHNLQYGKIILYR